MKTFREAVCARFDISPDAYEQEELWRCFFPPALAPGCMSVSEVRLELNDHRDHRRLAGLRRRILHLRLSGQRLVNLAGMVMQ
ncbi:MAG: hypothetical protein MUF81_12950 [Verrucomicrobia bacterium]|nr:hypothetical protein [Verrucomicrobiota bacterium]